MIRWFWEMRVGDDRSAGMVVLRGEVECVADGWAKFRSVGNGGDLDALAEVHRKKRGAGTSLTQGKEGGKDCEYKRTGVQEEMQWFCKSIGESEREEMSVAMSDEV